ncbi:hypothetical protein [Acinetobacter sp. c3-l95]|uniref:hypothetical protein n=1 Tax=Acinetobacter sp. c3-l95 TaxID=3342804 RepID=UPI0035B79AF9
MNEYDYKGCTTGFSENGQVSIFTTSESVKRDATAYVERLVAVNLLEKKTVSIPSPVITTPNQNVPIGCAGAANYIGFKNYGSSTGISFFVNERQLFWEDEKTFISELAKVGVMQDLTYQNSDVIKFINDTNEYITFKIVKKNGNLSEIAMENIAVHTEIDLVEAQHIDICLSPKSNISTSS